MRTELRPLDVAVRPGGLTVIEVEVGNTADVIDGVANSRLAAWQRS